jgi:hypothetical protein
LVENEMFEKLSHRKVCVGSNVSNNRYRNKKPRWNENLTELWNSMCEAEKVWNKGNNVNSKTLKAVFIQKRKIFGKEVQKAKRKYRYSMQEELLYESSKNQKFFWKKIGKIGVASDRKVHDHYGSSRFRRYCFFQYY